MLKIKNIKIVLLAAMVFLGINMSFGQVVTVPSPCVVVDPGAGGSIALNTVGNGGVVRMADNYAGGNFTTTVPAGYTQGSWTLKGDLSVTTTTFHNAVIQPSGNLSTYSIQSYNKFRRPTEGAANSAAAKLAKSKGTVRISYVNGPCDGAGMSFTVFKTYASASAPAIVGPTCVGAGVPVTFSVDRVASDNTADNIGFDEYYWNFVDIAGAPVSAPAMTNTYYSADSSSFTFTPTASASFIIKCAMGKANSSPWSTAGNLGPNPTTGSFSYPTFVTKVVGALPTAPTFISGTLVAGLSVCVDTGVNPLVITYALPPAGTTYQWTTPNNWTIGLSTTSFQTMNVGLDNNPGELRLKVTNSCTSVDFVYKIIRRFVAAPAMEIIPATTTCLTPGVGSTSFSLGSNATVNPAVSSSTNATSWSVSPSPSPGIFYINPNSLTTTIGIQTTANVPPGQYTLTATSNVGAYTYNGNSCTGSITKLINVLPPAPTFTATTPNCVVRGTTPVTTVALNSVVGYTYDWNNLPLGLPAGVTCTANCTTANPTFLFNSAATVPSVTLVAKVAVGNGCFSGTVSKTITYIQVTRNSQAGFPDQYAVSGACGAVTSWVVTNVNGATTYTTSVPNNVSITSIGGGTNNVLSLSGTGGPQITSICANLPGGIQVCTTNIGTFSQRTTTTTIANVATKFEDIQMYPNPTKGQFYINVADYNTAAAAIITDSLGKELGTYELIKGENNLSLTKLAKGIYFVTLLKDGQSEVRQIIIE